MTIHIKNNVNWVGQRDWEVSDFHGTEFKMTKGTSYNSYLIQEEKQYSLIRWTIVLATSLFRI